MKVGLGLGMLLRECKRVIEYEEDEATLNTPSYLGTSILSIKTHDLVIEAINTARGGVMGMVKAKEGQHAAIAEAAGSEERRADTAIQPILTREEKKDEGTEMEEMEEQKEKMAMLQEDMRKLEERKRKLEEDNQKLLEEIEKDSGGKDDMEDKEQHGEEEKAEEEEEVVVQKRKKRGKSGGSGRPSKKATTDIIRRSGRSRQPSKRPCESKAIYMMGWLWGWPSWPVPTLHGRPAPWYMLVPALWTKLVPLYTTVQECWPEDNSAGTSVHNSTGVLAGGWFLAELASTCPAHPAGTINGPVMQISLECWPQAGSWQLASTCPVHSASTFVQLCTGVLAGGWFLAELLCTGVLAGSWFLVELASTCPVHSAGTFVQLSTGVLAGGWFLVKLASTCPVHPASTFVQMCTGVLAGGWFLAAGQYLSCAYAEFKAGAGWDIFYSLLAHPGHHFYVQCD
ncbi:hypothetical protein F4604DRAFT_1679351 [Suillus subluteus]|nr:hypothetical protein F4604DRAFT_1679351 [Suillus subluteus]